jgi:hypothetical protein
MSEAAAYNHRDDRWLLFVFVTGPIAWGVQLLVGYGLVQFGCGFGAKWPVLALIAAAGLVTLLAGYVAVRHWRRLSSRGHADIDDLDDPEGAETFVAISGTLLCAVFFLAILVTGLTELIAYPCPYITMPLP